MEITFSLSSAVGESLQDTHTWDGYGSLGSQEKEEKRRRFPFYVFCLFRRVCSLLFPFWWGFVSEIAVLLCSSGPDWAETDQCQGRRIEGGNRRSDQNLSRLESSLFSSLLVFGGSPVPSLSYSLSSVKSTQGPFPPPQGQKRTRRSPFFLLLFSSRERRRRRRTPHTQTHNWERKNPRTKLQ